MVYLDIRREERDAIREKNAAKIEALLKEKNERDNEKLAKRKEILDHFLRKDILLAGNSKSECVCLCVISSLIKFFARNKGYLLMISNAIAPVLLSSGIASRSLAANRIVELLALGQKNEDITTFIFSKEYDPKQPAVGEATEERFCAVNLSPATLYNRGIVGDQKLYIDKKEFGWLCLPPYIRIYKGLIPYEKLTEDEKKADKFGQLLSNEEYIQKLITESILDHESKEEQELTKESSEPKSTIQFALRAIMGSPTGGNEMFTKTLSLLYRNPYSHQEKFFNPNQAVFYQSCFEYYGILLADIFRTHVFQ